jgi:meiosis induction protein kinase IME2/SME1
MLLRPCTRHPWHPPPYPSPSTIHIPIPSPPTTMSQLADHSLHPGLQRHPLSSSASPPSRSRITSLSSARHSPVRRYTSIFGPFSPPPGSTRSYTELKSLGDGSFGTVWLCDWHGTLPPNTPLSPMQCGAGAKPEWAGKRLVAVKRMRKKWEGGWDECQRLKELEVSLPFTR